MTTKDNILLVTVDSLRADDTFGDVTATPNVYRLTADGVTFETTVAQGPFTTFSMPSLFSSRYPSQLSRFELDRWGASTVVGDAPTLPERLSEAGYRTLGIHSNPLLSDAFGFDKGFDRFYDSTSRSTLFESRKMNVLSDKLRRLFRSNAYVPADTLTDIAVEWLSEVDTEPFFLWVHYMDVHGPYKERDRPPFLRKLLSEWRWQRAVHSPDEISPAERDRLRTLYRDEIEFTDEQIGRLLSAFDDRDLYEDATVVLTADHGEEFGEHGGFSHGNKLYEELLRVPLVVKPSTPTDVETVSEPTPLLDVTPTLVDLGGGSTDRFEGTALSFEETAVRGGSDGEIISEADFEPSYTASVRTAGEKYIRTGDSEELYDLSEDRDEVEDLSGADPETAAALRETLRAHLDRVEGARVDISVEDDEIEDRLETLGYL